MKRIRMITCLLAAVLAAAAFAGCGSTEVKTVDAPKQQEQGQQAPHKDRGTMAKVVSLDGNMLTVILADMPSRNRGFEGTPPAIGTVPDGTPPAIGAKLDNTAPDGATAGGPGLPSENQGQQGRGDGKIEFAGEESTYPLSNDVVVMKGVGDSAAEIDLSELALDDVIRFTTITDDNGKEIIDAIVVME